MIGRRRSLGLALVLGLGLLGFGPGLGCQAKESEPVAVARAFAATVRRGDVAGILALVEQPAVDRVQAAAETASDQVGGRRSIEASEMLQIVGVDRTVAVAEATLIDEDDRVAHVELTMTDGRSIRLELVWEPEGDGDGASEDAGRAGGWKVRIPMPSADQADGLGLAQPDA